MQSDNVDTDYAKSWRYVVISVLVADGHAHHHQATLQAPPMAGARDERTLFPVACPPCSARSRNAIPRPSIPDLFAVRAQRVSLGIVLYTATARRDAAYTTSNLLVRMRSHMGCLKYSRASRIPRETSQFFGHKDAIGVGTIAGKRGTLCKSKTGI